MINNEDIEDLIEKTGHNLEQLNATKGLEYANSDDRLANFKRLSAVTGVCAETVLLIFMTKHWDSINSYIRFVNDSDDAPVLSEPINERIDDLIMYLILFKGMIMDREKYSSTTIKEIK